MRCSTRPHHTLALRRRNYVHHRSFAWSPSFRRETHPSHYRNDPVKYDLVRRFPSPLLQTTKSESRLEKGIARTQNPTNKNYALELLTFETIVGVSSPGVQWTGLTLGEPPSWSWLTPAPGKYDVHLNLSPLSHVSQTVALIIAPNWHMRQSLIKVDQHLMFTQPRSDELPPPTGWPTMSESPLVLSSPSLREAFIGRAKTFHSIKFLTEWYTPLKKCYQAV